jgi:hypothetical protein
VKRINELFFSFFCAPHTQGRMDPFTLRYCPLQYLVGDVHCPQVLSYMYEGFSKYASEERPFKVKYSIQKLGKGPLCVIFGGLSGYMFPRGISTLGVNHSVLYLKYCLFTAYSEVLLLCNYTKYLYLV